MPKWASLQQTQVIASLRIQRYSQHGRQKILLLYQQIQTVLRAPPFDRSHTKLKNNFLKRISDFHEVPTCKICILGEIIQFSDQQGNVNILSVLIQN